MQIFNIYMHGAEPKALSPYLDLDLLTQNIQAATTVHVMLIAPFFIIILGACKFGSSLKRFAAQTKIIGSRSQGKGDP